VKPATKAILLIVGVAVLYIAALTLGIKREDSGDPNSDPKEQPGIDTLGKLTIPFAPRYQTRDLRCNGRLLARGPKLSADQTVCKIDIDPRLPDDDDYRVLMLEVAPEPSDATFAAYIRAVYKEKDNPRAKRDPDKCPFSSELEKIQNDFRLEISYPESLEPEDDEWDCWLKQVNGLPLRITVMRDEVLPLAPLPKLVLQCIGCDAGPPRAITLRAEDEE